MDARSIWYAGVPAKRCPAVTGDLSVHVAIVGGGITGLVTAYLLATQGISVAVLEAFRVGEGSTGHSTGNLYEIVSEREHKLGDAAPQVVAARRDAIELIARIAGECGIACGLARRPWYLFSETQDDTAEIGHIRDTAARAKLTLSTARPPAPFAARVSVRLNGQAQFNPLGFSKGLADAILARGGQVFEDSPVIGYDDDPRTLHTPTGKVRANHVVMATHVPKGVHLIDTTLAPYREYGIAAPIGPGALAPGIYWTSGEERHSVRTHAVGDRTYLIVIGGSHKTGQDDNAARHYAELAQWASARFGTLDVQYRWSAQNYRAADGLPYIGRLAGDDHVHFATGFAADGLTYGAMSALILADAVRGITHPCAAPFAADRHRPLAAAKDVITENLNVFREYLRDLPHRSHDKELASLAPGEGRVIEIDGDKIAASRTVDGRLLRVSAVCTHMKCIVRWNTAERSWDCPCHGSRFAADGRVIEGPALANLPRVDS